MSNKVGTGNLCKKTIVYLIRHSKQLKFNENYNSKDDEQIRNEKIILSIEGEEKALQLSKNIELQEIDKIYSSNYVRAIATAKYIAATNKLDINIDERLGERKLGDLKALDEIMIKENQNYTVQQLIDCELKNINGESNKEVKERMLKFLDEVLNEPSNKKIAIVSHGAAIKFLLQNWCEYNYEKDAFYFNAKFVCFSKIDSPSIIKLIFQNRDLISAELLEE